MRRSADGKFIVKLPLREACNQLGNSSNKDFQRFLLFEKRFKVNSNLKSEYIKFMREYYELNHMEKCEYDNQNENMQYFLPHHAVCLKMIVLLQK